MAALAAVRVASRDPAEALTDLARAASVLFGAQAVLITVGHDDIWYRGSVGLPDDLEFPPEALVPPGLGPYVAPDGDPGHVPELTTRLGARFFAGAPILAPAQEVVGAVCILDEHPRVFAEVDLQLLRAVGERAYDEVLLRVERERLEEFERVQGEVVAWTAHEMKNPLTVILGISSMLASDPKFPLNMRVRFLNTISDQANRLLRLIDETLDIARLEQGQQLRLDLQTLDLADLVRRVATSVQSTTSRHEIACNLAPGSHRLEGDSDRLEQVLFNLIGNAVKYSPEGGPVEVRTEVLDELLILSIADHGLGMDGDQLDRLFGRYIRLHTETQPGIRGTGLGLFYTRHLVEAHGGVIWAESHPGQGSRFFVRLPRSAG